MMDKSSKRIPNRTNIALNLYLNTGQAQAKTPSSFGTVGKPYKVQAFGFSIKTFCLMYSKMYRHFSLVEMNTLATVFAKVAIFL